jgi:hypothetical protein
LKYSNLNTWYTIPVIVISTLTGTANFAQDRIPAEYQALFVVAVGGFNLLAGIITTIQQFLKITQLNEAHRVAGIAWDKFYRNIKVEIAKHPDERTDPIHFLKICKEEYDRLMETCPVIPQEIVLTFKSTFNNGRITNKDFDSISKPEILDILISTANFRYNKELEPVVSEDSNIKNKKKEVLVNYNKIKEYCNIFKQIHGREASIDEIVENFESSIEARELSLITSSIEKQRLNKENDNNNNIELEVIVNNND